MTRMSRTRHLTLEDAVAYVEDMEELLEIVNKELEEKEQEYDNLRFDIYWSEEKVIKTTSEIVRLRIERNQSYKSLAFYKGVVETMKNSKRRARKL